jgi:hypothetical protein
MMARRKKKAGDLGDLVGVVIVLIVGAGILQHGKDLSVLLVIMVAAVALMHDFLRLDPPGFLG